MFTLNDAFQRAALTGTCTGVAGVTPSVTAFNGMVLTVTFSTSGSYKGYNVQKDGTGSSLSGATVLTANYYDNYSFLSLSGFSTLGYESSAEASGYGQRYATDSRTLLTGSYTAQLENSTGYDLCSAFYYDNRKRLVQTQATSHLAGGREKEYVAYNFVGEPVKRQYVHSATGKTAQTTVYTYEYDNWGRMLKTLFQKDGGAVITLVENTYDSLGRLQSRKLHNSVADATSYSYNIRDWVTGISGSKFSENLYYNTGVGTPRYNGNISSMTWNGGDGVTRGYKYEYDGLDRLTDAAYGEGASIGSNAGRFTESVPAYDRNGNILALQRYGQTSAAGYGLIDNLSMTLDGNRLRAVNDAAGTAAYNGGFEFVNRASLAVEYAYDVNGNLTKDLNKNITDIQYNLLNLPNQVTFADGSKITYTYAADGTKLKAVHQIGGTSTSMDYCGNVIYENGVARQLLTEAGYISLDNGQYHYYLQDHQGNNRIVASQGGSIEETNHYYPFGGLFANSTLVQPYKYNGKELDTKKGLNWYDYGARQYDAALGRWHAIDLSAEKYYLWSPYVYCYANPIRYFDPNGKDGWDSLWGTIIGYATNVIPGTGGLRDFYSPTDPADYNNALRNADNNSLVLGAGMIDVGSGGMAAGGTIATTGVVVTVASGGTATIAGVPTVAAGVTLTEAGVVTAETGAMLMGNAEQNKSEGYDRGKQSNVSSGNKNSSHANQKAKSSAEQKYQEAQKRYQELKTKSNKTVEEARTVDRLRKQAKHWKKEKDFSGENHSRNAKGNR